MNPKSVSYYFAITVVTITLGTGTIVAHSNASSSDSDFPVAVKEHAASPTVITGDNMYIV
jgi:hypothetical protein